MTDIPNNLMQRMPSDLLKALVEKTASAIFDTMTSGSLNTHQFEEMIRQRNEVHQTAEKDVSVEKLFIRSSEDNPIDLRVWCPVTFLLGGDCCIAGRLYYDGEWAMYRTNYIKSCSENGRLICDDDGQWFRLRGGLTTQTYDEFLELDERLPSINFQWEMVDAFSEGLPNNFRMWIQTVAYDCHTKSNPTSREKPHEEGWKNLQAQKVEKGCNANTNRSSDEEVKSDGFERNDDSEEETSVSESFADLDVDDDPEEYTDKILKNNPYRNIFRDQLLGRVSSALNRKKGQQLIHNSRSYVIVEDLSRSDSGQGSDREKLLENESAMGCSSGNRSYETALTKKGHDNVNSYNGKRSSKLLNKSDPLTSSKEVTSHPNCRFTKLKSQIVNDKTRKDKEQPSSKRTNTSKRFSKRLSDLESSARCRMSSCVEDESSCIENELNSSHRQNGHLASSTLLTGSSLMSRLKKDRPKSSSRKNTSSNDSKKPDSPHPRVFMETNKSSETERKTADSLSRRLSVDEVSSASANKGEDHESSFCLRTLTGQTVDVRSLSRSRSGRIIIPRLDNWRGQGINVVDGQVVEIHHGKEDKIYSLTNSARPKRKRSKVRSRIGISLSGSRQHGKRRLLSASSTPNLSVAYDMDESIRVKRRTSISNTEAKASANDDNAIRLYANCIAQIKANN